MELERAGFLEARATWDCFPTPQYLVSRRAQGISPSTLSSLPHLLAYQPTALQHRLHQECPAVAGLLLSAEC